MNMNATSWPSTFPQDLTTSSFNYDDIIGHVTEVTLAPVGETFEPFKNTRAFRTYAIFIAMIGIVGILSNGLVLYVLSTTKKKFKSLATRLIVHQCIVDLVTSALMLVGYIYHAFQRIKYQGVLGKVLCVLFGGDCLVWIGLNTSTLHLIVITLERYARIRFPVWHHNNTTRYSMHAAMMACFCFSSLWTASFSVAGSVLVPPGICLSMIIWPSRAVSDAFSFGSFVIFFAIPLILFCCFYTHMFLLLVKRNAKIAPMTQNQLPTPAFPSTENSQDNASNSVRMKMSKTQINITQTMVSVCLVFVLCWTPIQITFVLLNLGVTFKGYIYCYQILLFMALLNSCVNPFIYAAKLLEFKKGLSALVENTFRRPVINSTVETSGDEI